MQLLLKLVSPFWRVSKREVAREEIRLDSAGSLAGGQCLGCNGIYGPGRTAKDFPRIGSPLRFLLFGVPLVFHSPGKTHTPYSKYPLFLGHFLKSLGFNMVNTKPFLVEGRPHTLKRGRVFGVGLWVNNSYQHGLPGK